MFKCKRCKKPLKCNWKYCEECDEMLDKERQKEYNKSPKAKISFRKYQKKYEQTNKKRREYRKKWLKENREKIKKYNHNYYEKYK